MLGAIAGDVIGSVFERARTKRTDFTLFTERSTFTDDSVLTIAIADVLLTGAGYTEKLQEYGRRYPSAGYGGNFYRWLLSPTPAPYGSWGNGSAMRVSPVGYAFDSLEKVLQEAKDSAAVTHNAPEGIAGAQATAAAVFLARQGSSKDEIKDYVESTFSYDLSTPIDDIRPSYTFDVSCQGSVPQALRCFYEARDVEEAIRLAISLGGDADTQACIAGAVAEAYFGPLAEELGREVMARLDEDLRKVYIDFKNKFIYPGA